MSDPISRQAAIAAFRPYALYDSNRTNAEWVRRIELVLEELPSAEKHGKWIFENRTWFHQPYLKCSCCGRRQFFARFDYCPYCGARMEADE